MLCYATRTRRGFRVGGSIFLEEIDFGWGRRAADLAREVPSVRGENFRVTNDIVEIGFVLERLQPLVRRCGHGHLASAAFEAALNRATVSAFGAFLSDQQDSHARFIRCIRVTNVDRLFDLLLAQPPSDAPPQPSTLPVTLKV